MYTGCYRIQCPDVYPKLYRQFDVKMMREIVFLVSSFLVCWKGVYPFLDVDELKNIHYDIDIVDQPVLLGRPMEQEVVYMTSKYGQRYECRLPDIGELELELEEEKAASEIGVSELLKPMETAPCLIKTKDWWSYEFCYGKKIEQYHLENDKIIGDVVVLGVYESETDWSDNATTDSRKNRLNRYHSHNYINGSTCDISGKPRQAEVRFHCAEGEGDSISRIDEPTTCSYILTIHTTRICHHPYLKPPPKVKPKSVLCSPALTQNQFDTYMYHQEQAEIEMKRKAEEDAEAVRDMKASWFEQLLGISKKSNKKEEREREEDDETSNDGALDSEGATHSEELHDVLEKYADSLSIANIDDAIAMGIDPKTLAKVLGNVMDTVQDSLQAIDEEVTALEDNVGESKATQQASQAIDEDDDEDYDDYDEDDDDDELTDLDYKSLLADFREGIDDMDVNQEEAQRLRALADELEKSFQNVEVVEKLLQKEKNDEEDDAEDGEGSEDEDVGRQEMKEAHGDKENARALEEDDDDDDDASDDDENVEMDKDAQKKLVSKVNELIKKLTSDTTADKDKNLESTLDPASPEDDIDDRVRVRVTRINLNQDSENAQEKEVNLYDPEHKSLEEAIQDHLEQSGIQVEGGKIELKVLTYKPDDWPDVEEEDSNIAILSEEETTYFKNIVSGLLGNQGKAEEVKHEKMKQNYRFHWDKDNHRISEETDQEDEPSPDSFL